MQVTDPDGVEWEVSRQWLRVPRWRVGRPHLEDVVGAPIDSDFDLAGIAAWIALTLVLFVLLLVGLPLLVFLLAVLVAIVGLVSRVVFRRPWLVRARSDRGELEWRVRGALGSRRAIHEVARALERGDRSVLPKGAERVLPESPLQQLR